MNTTKPAAALPPLRIPRLDDIAPTIMLLLAARADAIGMCPFGLAFFAAVYDKQTAYLGIAAAGLGIISRAGIAALPKHLIALILFWLFSRMYKKAGDTASAIVCGTSMLTGGLAMLFMNFSGIYDIFLLLTESIISALMYIVFKKSRFLSDDFKKRGKLSSEEYVSAAAAAGVIISGMSNIGIFGVRLTNVFGIYVILITALNSSIAVAACTGMSIGFLCAMGSSAAVMMMGVYGLGAMLASFMNTFRKIGCAAGCICGMAVTMIYIKNASGLPLSMRDVFISCALFVATPRIVHDYLHSFFTKTVQAEPVSPDARMREYLTMRLHRTGEAFASLYECFVSVSEGRLKKYSEDIGVILDETADRICADCKMCGKCWQGDFRKTYKNILGLISIIETDGKLTAENIPPHFCESCIKTKLFINELNHVYELYKRDVLRRSDAVVTRNLISAQYRELNRLFNGMASDVESGFYFLEDAEEKLITELDKAGISPYEVSIVECGSGRCEVYLRLPQKTSNDITEGVISSVLGRPAGLEKSENELCIYATKPNYTVDSTLLQLPQEGSVVNGDSAAIFVTESNKFYAIIADGMGSGSEAQYESAAALRLLTSFLRSGFSVKTALGILNSAMCINMDNEIYSTIDLLGIDLYSGEAELYKIGSAETIVLTGGEVKALSSTSVPIGILSDICLDNKTMQLGEGDVILMLTDGITEAGYAASRTEWIKKIAVKPFEKTEELAREVMDTALSKNRGIPKDDMSVIALRLLSV